MVIKEGELPKSLMYPEGRATITIVMPATVREALKQVAVEQRLSMSQLAAGVLENWLKAQGRLPMRSVGSEVSA